MWRLGVDCSRSSAGSGIGDVIRMRCGGSGREFRDVEEVARLKIVEVLRGFA